MHYWPRPRRFRLRGAQSVLGQAYKRGLSRLELDYAKAIADSSRAKPS